MPEPPKALWQGEIKVGSIHLDCYVMDDGRRVVDPQAWRDFVNDTGFETASGRDDLRKLVAFLRRRGVPRGRDDEKPKAVA
jgi:hypothetical protein